jgi:hypothetical protein
MTDKKRILITLKNNLLYMRSRSGLPAAFGMARTLTAFYIL